MPRRPTSAEVIRVLGRNGFALVSQKGSHCKFKNSTGRVVIVPHPKKELPIGTTRSIIRQSGLTPADFGF
jgi:predicted RNA binding protein YcfA (HicA-like mRNA interferase family)